MCSERYCILNFLHGIQDSSISSSDGDLDRKTAVIYKIFPIRSTIDGQHRQISSTDGTYGDRAEIRKAKYYGAVQDNTITSISGSDKINL